MKWRLSVDVRCFAVVAMEVEVWMMMSGLFDPATIGSLISH